MRRYLGLDIGTKRCGVAMSDKTNTLVSPLKTISYNMNNYASLAGEIDKLIAENNITDLVIGYPKNMDGTSGFATKRGEEFISYLSSEVDIHLEDERLSTVFAQNILFENGKNTKNSKRLIDTVSACLILETFMKREENAKK